MSKGKYAGRLLAGLMLWGAVGAAQAAAVGDPIGLPVRASEGTPTSYYPDIGRDAAGNSFVVWANQTAPAGVYGRRYDAVGQALGGEFHVGATSVGTTKPAVAVNARGDTVVVWESSATYVYANRYDANGDLVGPIKVPASTFAANERLSQPDVGIDANGNYVVVWIRETAGVSRVLARRFSAAGEPLAAAQLVADVGQQYSPSIAVSPDGSYVVTWIDPKEDGEAAPENVGVKARRYSAAGVALGAPFTVPNVTALVQTSARVASDGAGNFVVVWRSQNANGRLDFSARLFDAAGNPRGNQFTVNTPDSDNMFINFEYYPAVSMALDGKFAVAWRRTDETLLARHYDALGTALTDEFRVFGSGAAPSLAQDGSGDIEVVAADSGFGGNIVRARHSGAAEVDLAVAISDSPDPVAPGSPLQYSLYVSNNTAVPVATGNATQDAHHAAAATAHDVTATVSLEGAAFVSAAGAGWTCTGTVTVACRYGELLSPGAIAPLLTVAAQGTPAATSVTARVIVADAHVDPNPANNEAVETTSIAGGSSGPGPDTVPDGYSFIDAGNVARATVVASNAVTITGINQPTPISVAGGEYQIGSGAWTAAAGTVSNGQIVRVRHTSAAGFSAETLTTLDVGGIAAAFRSVTLAQQTMPQAFSFATQSGVEPATTLVSNPAAIAGINDAAAVSVSGGEYAINGGAFTSVAGNVNNGDTVEVRVVSGPFGESRSATLVVGGTSASFTVISRGAPEAPPLVVKNGGGAWGAGTLLLLALAGLRRRLQ